MYSMADSDSSDKRSAIKRIYEDKYKLLMLIPFLILALAVIQIGVQISTTGDFMVKGVSLKGGVSMSVPDISVDPVDMESFLSSKFPEADFSVRRLPQSGGVVIDADIEDESALVSAVSERLGGLSKEQYTVEVFGSSLGSSFFDQTFRAIILAFLFMGTVVFIRFRSLGPSMGVILAAFSDIVVTLAVVNVMGMKLSTAGIAAFLMLIGYSVDTDILLSTRVLMSKHGSVMDRVYSSMKTGMMMTVTTMVAVTVGILVSRSETITQIMTILLIGLFVDIIMTYVQNVGILRLFLERKHAKTDH